MPARGTSPSAGRVPQQRIEQRSFPVAAARMHHEAGRFVDDEEGVVLVDDIERNILRQVCEHRGIGRRADLYLFAARELVPRQRGPPVDGHAMLAHPVRETAARMLGQQARERLVQAQPRAVLGRDQRQGVRLGPCAIIRAYDGRFHI